MFYKLVGFVICIFNCGLCSYFRMNVVMPSHYNILSVVLAILFTLMCITTVLLVTLLCVMLQIVCYRFVLSK